MSKQASFIKFQSEQEPSFYKAVKARVSDYFKENNLSPKANTAMVLKTIILLSLYWGAYGLLISDFFSLSWMWFFCFIMGVSMPGIGFCISHDALHGAYSSHPKVNTILGWTFYFLGVNTHIWNITHNKLHHTFTNIYGCDEDLEVASFIRMSPHAQRKPIHRFQHWLIFPSYALSTVYWCFVKDYWYFLKSSTGPYRNIKHPPAEWLKLIGTKLLAYTYMIIFPLVFLNLAWWQFLIGFFTIHLTAGLVASTIFQLAHVVEKTQHLQTKDGKTMQATWSENTMYTTHNFARNNKILTWFVGGLNFQIEHHLFPKICSIHYPNISNIVKETAQEFGLPYHCSDTLREAIGSHYRTIKHFGLAKAPA